MKLVLAIASGLFVFAGVFLLAGLFIMPYVPPVPDHPVNAFQLEFWTDNWAGTILGLGLGLSSARASFRRATPRESE